MSLIVQQALLPILTVDKGRVGVLSQGYTESGPMDELAYRWALKLAGMQAENALEAMGEVRFAIMQSGYFAVCGPNIHIQVDGLTVPSWSRFRANKGQQIQITSASIGQRYYVAVSGGFAFPQALDSACTVIREQLGGIRLNGSPVKTEDQIAFNLPVIPHTEHGHCEVPVCLRPQYSLSQPIRVVEGYQVSEFDQLDKMRFYTSDYTVTQSVDRMGYRLSGPAVQSRIQQLSSEGIALGAIQFPPNGQPIVMMRDRQTLGGYPKIGAVARCDLSRFAQSVPGDRIRFTSIDAANARALWLLEVNKLLSLF